MIAGLPPESWLLMAVAVGAGLAIELAFLRAQRRVPGEAAPGEGAPTGDGERAP